MGDVTGLAFSAVRTVSYLRLVVQVDRSEIMLGVLIQLFSDGEQFGSGSCLFRARNRWAREPL